MAVVHLLQLEGVSTGSSLALTTDSTRVAMSS